MALLSKTYYGGKGSKITDPEIAFVNVLVVTREGKQYDIIDGVPDGDARQVMYDAPRGTILFSPDNPFRLSLQGYGFLPETVTVLYETL